MNLMKNKQSAGTGVRFRSLLRNLGILAAAAAVSCTAVAPAYASGASGTITKVAYTGSRILFWVNGGKTGSTPSCDCCGRYEIVVSDANSQALMSIIMTAYGAGRTVGVSGSGSCVQPANDTEGVSYIESL